MSKNDIPDIVTEDGLQLRVFHWPTETPKAVLVLIHGFGEHMGRYEHVGKALNEAGIAMIGMDLRGHGLSKGKRGHAKSYQHLQNDIEELLKTARAEYTETPLFLMGHSMGGNLVGNFVMENTSSELKGYIMSSPWIKLAFDPPQWQVKAAEVLSNTLPGLAMDNNLDSAYLTRNAEINEQYDQDPLVLHKISAGLFQMITNAGRSLLKSDKSIEIPGFIYHGDADQITDYQASLAFFRQQTKASWNSWDNGHHESHNDLDQQQVIHSIVQWITELVNQKV